MPPKARAARQASTVSLQSRRQGPSAGRRRRSCIAGQNRYGAPCQKSDVPDGASKSPHELLRYTIDVGPGVNETATIHGCLEACHRQVGKLPGIHLACPVHNRTRNELDNIFANVEFDADRRTLMRVSESWAIFLIRRPQDGQNRSLLSAMRSGVRITIAVPCDRSPRHAAMGNVRTGAILRRAPLSMPPRQTYRACRQARITACHR